MMEAAGRRNKAREDLQRAEKDLAGFVAIEKIAGPAGPVVGALLSESLGAIHSTMAELYSKIYSGRALILNLTTHDGKPDASFATGSTSQHASEFTPLSSGQTTAAVACLATALCTHGPSEFNALLVDGDALDVLALQNMLLSLDKLPALDLIVVTTHILGAWPGWKLELLS